jgi:hypothetical protein
MADYWALLWKIKPGSQEAVAELFENYGVPDHVVRDADGNDTGGMLVGTFVFMKDTTIVRVVEIENSTLPEVAAHMGRQPSIKELEEKLDPHLAEPRDMSNPEGARKFFMESSMRCLVARRVDV